MTAAHVSRSWPTVGSSASTSAGPCAMAEATARRRCSPPERWRGSVPARRVSPRVASSSSARLCASVPSWPRARAVVSTSSRTVRPTTAVAARCGTQATTRARSTDDHSWGGRDRSRARPRAPRCRPSRRRAAGVRGRAMSTRPVVGASRPPTAAISVVLPAPLGPVRAVTCPATTSRSDAGDRGRAARGRAEASAPSLDPETCAGHHGLTGLDDPGCRARRRGECHVQRLRLRRTWHPDPLLHERIRMAGEHLVGWAVGDDAAIAVEHDESVDEVEPARRAGAPRRRGSAGGARRAPPPPPAPPLRWWRRASRSARRGAAAGAP